MNDTLDPGFDRESTIELLEYAQDIPSLPDRFMKIQQVIHDPRSNAEDLARVIGTDQATTAMVLKVANSAAFNPMRQPVAELSKAIARLGTRETAHIAQAMALMYGLVLPTGMVNIRVFWGHAYAVALIAEHLARVLDAAETRCPHERVFVAGLLHDIGRAALGMRVDLGYFERPTGHLHGERLIELERRWYGMDHAEAGERLMRRWELPDELCVAIGQHHDAEPQLWLARLVRRADLYAHEHLPEKTPFEDIPETVVERLAEFPPEDG